MADEPTGLIWAEIGKLKGVVDSMGQRLDRNEDWVGAKLNSIDSKMDEVRTTLAAAAGSAKMGKTLMVVAVPLASAVMTFLTWMFTHFVMIGQLH